MFDYRSGKTIRKKLDIMSKVGITSVIAALLFATILGGLGYRGTAEDVTFTVRDKERVVKQTGERVNAYYLVFTDDEVFKNTDSMFFGKFNSSDFQGEMREGSVCDATVAGWRVPFFSMYRNIVEVDCGTA